MNKKANHCYELCGVVGRSDPDEQCLHSIRDPPTGCRPTANQAQ